MNPWLALRSDHVFSLILLVQKSIGKMSTPPYWLCVPGAPAWNVLVEVAMYCRPFLSSANLVYEFIQCQWPIGEYISYYGFVLTFFSRGSLKEISQNRSIYFIETTKLLILKSYNLAGSDDESIN